MDPRQKLIGFRKRLNDVLRFSLFNPAFIETNAIRLRLLKDRSYMKGILVDVGCGEKPYYRFLRPLVKKYFGVEVFTTYADVDRKVDVLTDHFVMPFKDECCDTVLVLQVLEHTFEPVRLLKSVRSMLKKDGFLIVTVPKTGAIHEMPYDFFRYTPYSLNLILKEAGFETVSIEPVGTFGQMLTVTFLGFFARKLQYSASTLSYLLKALFIIPLTVLVNLFGMTLALLIRDDKDTLDFRIVAQRCDRD